MLKKVPEDYYFKNVKNTSKLCTIMMLISLPFLVFQALDKGKVFKYSAKYASADFLKARMDAELFDFTFHDARHTAATRIALKIPLLDLCKMFGWSNPKRAMTYYNPTASEIASRL